MARHRTRGYICSRHKRVVVCLAGKTRPKSSTWCRIDRSRVSGHGIILRESRHRLVWLGIRIRECFHPLSSVSQLSITIFLSGNFKIRLLFLHAATFQTHIGLRVSFQNPDKAIVKGNAFVKCHAISPPWFGAVS